MEGYYAYNKARDFADGVSSTRKSKEANIIARSIVLGDERIHIADFASDDYTKCLSEDFGRGLIA